MRLPLMDKSKITVNQASQGECFRCELIASNAFNKIKIKERSE